MHSNLLYQKIVVFTTLNFSSAVESLLIFLKDRFSYVVNSVSHEESGQYVYRVVEMSQ